LNLQRKFTVYSSQFTVSEKKREKRKSNAEAQSSQRSAEEEKGEGFTTEGTKRPQARCHDPSTARPDAPQDGAKEKIGPLRSG